MWSITMVTRAIHLSPVSVMPPVLVNARVVSIAEVSLSDSAAMVTGNSKESIKMDWKISSRTLKLLPAAAPLPCMVITPAAKRVLSGSPSI